MDKETNLYNLLSLYIRETFFKSLKGLKKITMPQEKKMGVIILISERKAKNNTKRANLNPGL